MAELVLGAIYQHYKGTQVKVLHEVRHSETKEPMVAYIHLEDGELWVRPKDMFLELVEVDGKTQPRFKLTQ